MKAITTNSFHAWVLAARPKTLTGAIIPVLIGSALAFADGKSDLIPALLCALFACGMQIAANFINDLYDYLKGSDRTDRLGPERACAQGWITPIAMKRGIMGMLVFSCLIGCALLRQCWGQLPHGGWELILLGLLCVIFAFLYTTVLSYRGWGDLLVLVFFGFIPVGGTYYVQAHAITADVWIASLICGLVIDTLLVVNNYRDREQDALSGKKTIVVRLGSRAGLMLYFLLGMAACWCCFYFIGQGKLWAGVLPQIYLFPHILTTIKMARIHKGRELNIILGETSRNMLLFGVLLCAGLLA